MKAIRSLSAIIAVTVCVVVSGAGAAQPDDLSALSKEELLTIASNQRLALTELGAQLETLTAARTENAVDPAIEAAFLEVRLSYYAAQKQQNDTIVALLKEQEAVFDYQDRASYTLLVLVVVICSAGVVFSGYELTKTVRTDSTTGHPTGGEKPAGGDVGAQSPTKLSIGASGIQITSALTGILVLTISLAFLYLFLKEVYAIDTVRVPTINGSQESQTTS